MWKINDEIKQHALAWGEWVQGANTYGVILEILLPLETFGAALKVL